MKLFIVVLIFSAMIAYASATPILELEKLDDHELGVVSAMRNRRFLCGGYASDEQCRNHCVNDLHHWMGGSCQQDRCQCLD